ncbi:MAG: DsbA family oxidoreductase [Alphaproteobacteria bacterium]
MRIEIVSDVICPWCFIGKRRLEQALALHPLPDLEIAWRPFELNPGMPKEGMSRAEYVEAKFGSAARGQTVYDRVADAGRESGLVFAFDRMTRIPNTIDAHRLIRLAGRARVQNALVEGLFSAYFLEGRNIGDTKVLTEIARAARIEPGAIAHILADDSEVEAIKSEISLAQEMGVSSVPFFIFDGVYGISGAQPPETFVEVFKAIEQENARAEADGLPAATRDAV